jgi:hypothetical protein
MDACSNAPFTVARTADVTMAESRRVHGLAALQRAFDEVRFGAARTLNLRESLPTGAEAARRVEAWLRQHQVQQSSELLVITGRGNKSEAGVAVVREVVIRVFHELRRKGVVEAFEEHTPGSFVVRLAPLSAAVAGRQSTSAEAIPPPLDPPTLEGLTDTTRDQLRVLALGTLDALGVRNASPAIVRDEMVRQCARLAAALPGALATAEQREAQLQRAIARAIEDLDDA